MAYHVNESEYRFMEILWKVEPVNSMELVRICQKKLGWKKSTTYTVIRKLSDKNIVCNEEAVVRTLVSRDSMQKQESNEFLDRKFGGSLPSFVTAFLQDRKLTREEAEYLKKLIQEKTEED